MDTVIAIEPCAQGWLIRLEGPIRTPVAARLLAVAKEAVLGPEVAVHGGAVADIDTAALQVLVALSAALARSQRRLRLVAASPELLGALALAAIEDRFVLEVTP